MLIDQDCYNQSLNKRKEKQKKSNNVISKDIEEPPCQGKPVLPSFYVYLWQFYAIIGYPRLMLCYGILMQCYDIGMLCYRELNCEMPNDMVC